MVKVRLRATYLFRLNMSFYIMFRDDAFKVPFVQPARRRQKIILDP